jgi:N utilization substance protein B
MPDNKKLTRHEIREGALLLLYQVELTDTELSDVIEECTEAFGLETNTAMLKLAEGIIENKTALDEIISKYSQTRKVERIPKINLVIMRMGLYEMDFLPDIPDKVAMNEAIELSKEYADQPDSKLISGLLGNYYRDKYNEQ